MYDAKINASNALEAGLGYSLDFSFQKHELDLARSLIEEQWIENIKLHSRAHWKKFSKIEMARYHELSNLIDHASIWPKSNRILPQHAVDLIRSTSLLKSLENIYGPYVISDEEKTGGEEIYWRLVRPQQPSDIGPLHADAWYWELGHGVTPVGVKRIKVWIAIYCEPGLNGLRLVPDSHKKQWQYHSERRDGFSKPRIDEDESKLAIHLIHTNPGDAIVFNDKLLHGGALNNGANTRVSLEFTMFIKN